MSSLKVLVIDDNAVARAMLTDMLTSFGHEVVGEADSLAKAVEQFKTKRPDLVTLDVAMPGADGLTVLKALRKEDVKAKVLIVSCTPENNRIYTALKEAGADGFLVKPFELDELEATLQKVTGG